MTTAIRKKLDNSKRLRLLATSPPHLHLIQLLDITDSQPDLFHDYCFIIADCEVLLANFLI